MIFGRKREAKLEVGQDVTTADEEHLGTISAVEEDWIEISSDTLGSQQTWRVPRSAVAKAEEQEVQLSLSRVQVMTRTTQSGAGTSESQSSNL
jgi:hypothetical protein